MTAANERPESEGMIAVIFIVSVVAAILFAIVVGELGAVVVALPLFLGLSIVYSLLASLFFWPRLRWGVVVDILLIPFSPWIT